MRFLQQTDQRQLHLNAMFRDGGFLVREQVGQHRVPFIKDHHRSLEISGVELERTSFM